MSVMQKVVDYAKSQIGYLSTIKGDKKYQKYGEDIDTNHVGWYNGKKNGWDWCTQFVDDSYIQTYGEPAARILLNRPKGADLGAVVKYQYNYMKQAGQVGTTPRVGAIVYFQNSKGLCHVGIVVGVVETGKERLHSPVTSP